MSHAPVGTDDGPLVISDLLAPLALALALASSAWVTSRVWRSGLCRSGSLFWFWLMLALAATVKAASVVQARLGLTGKSIWRWEEEATLMLTLPAVLTVFVLHFFTDPLPEYAKLGLTGPIGSPDECSSFPSHLFFLWMIPVFRRGWQKPLQSSDLPDLARSNNVKEFYTKVWVPAHEKICGGKPGSVNILVVMAAVYSPLWLLASVLQTGSHILLLIAPKFQSLLIEHAENDKQELWKGYLYMLGLFVVNMTGTLMNNHHLFYMLTCGTHIWTSLSCSLYDKAFRLSTAARRERTTGEIFNLIATDSRVLNDLVYVINVPLNTALILSLSVYLLWQHIGRACLVGLAVLVATFPLLAATSRVLKQKQRKLVQLKDARIKVMGEVLDGIKVIKVNTWEGAFHRHIRCIRNNEIHTLATMRCINVAVDFILQTVPFAVALSSFAAFTALDSSCVLNAERAFVSMSYFRLMLEPLEWISKFLTKSVQCAVSVARINDFLSLPEVDLTNIEDRTDDQTMAIVADWVQFTWGGQMSYKLDLSPGLNIKKGSLVGVTGKVGSGKSSLLSSLIGNMEKQCGTLAVQGTIAYVPQVPFIFNASFQDNIIFGLPLDEGFYERVIDACALREDIQTLPNSDLSEIGEKGINLSGGQRQRLGVARAIYSNRDIYLLDDPMASVDAKVGNHMFHQLFGAREGLLKDKTRVVVTHSMELLSKADLIVVMRDGAIEHTCSREDMKDQDRSRKTWEAIKQYCVLNLQVREGKESVPPDTVLEQEQGNVCGSSIYLNSPREDRTLSGALVEVENVETKSVGLSVYLYYFRVLGFGLMAIALACHMASQGLDVGSNFLLAKWSSKSNSSDPDRRNLTYLKVYGAVGALSSLSSTIGAAMILFGGLTASRLTHDRMLLQIMSAPMSFFDTNPKGRLLNRFSSDMAEVDLAIPLVIDKCVTLILKLAGISFVLGYVLGSAFLILLLAVIACYGLIQIVYVTSARQIKRMASANLSLAFSHVKESLSGVLTIRAYNKCDFFSQQLMDKVQEVLSPFFYSNFANIWNSTCLEMLGNIVIASSALFAVAYRHSVTSGTIGLSLGYAIKTSSILSQLMAALGALEYRMVGAERIKEYEETTPSEASRRRPEVKTPSNWPQQGTIRFENYSARYRPGLDMVLKDISCTIRSGEKVGIVGRTGAGKSSLSAALFRLIEPETGTFYIDDVDASKIDLRYLRSGLCMMPQEPVLYSGTLRSNIDLFESHTDEEIHRVTKLTNLDKTFLKRARQGLESVIEEGGSNLSIGQRQLVCLARTLLRRCRILVLDEATAALDSQTDAFIRETIKREFQDSTVLTIAHRLNTILDSDRIMVLEDGRLVEFDSPEALLNTKVSRFRAFAKEANIM